MPSPRHHLRERERDLALARKVAAQISGADNVMPAPLGGQMMETKVKAVELRELWQRCKEEGDERARERLVVAYSPLVKFIAGRMASGLPAHVEEADLISYGLLGLIGAIDRYDPDRDIKFETYAIARIRGAILDE